jgi:hypothetical protein
MQVENVNNPSWANEEHTMIDAIVKWTHLSEAHPFTASADDVEAHGRKLFEDLISGIYGEIKPFISNFLNNSADSSAINSFPTPPSGEIPVVVFK